MSFKRKNKLMIILAFAMIMFNSFAYAAAPAEDKEVSPRGISTCSSSSDGKHHFIGNGIGRVYLGAYPNESNCVISGLCCICRYCNAVIVSQYNPYYSVCLGDYVVSNSYRNMNIDGASYTTIWTTSVLHNDKLYGDIYTQGMVFE